MDTPDLPKWLFDEKGEPVWWYDPARHDSPMMQALRYACSSRHADFEQVLARMEYWKCPAVEAAFASEDGYFPGIRWNYTWPDPREDQPVVLQHPLSVHRFVATLRYAHDHREEAAALLEELAEVLGRRPKRRAS